MSDQMHKLHGKKYACTCICVCCIQTFKEESSLVFLIFNVDFLEAVACLH